MKRARFSEEQIIGILRENEAGSKAGELARKHGVEMPITEVVEAVMRDGLPVEQAASMLASRSAKPEWYGP